MFVFGAVATSSDYSVSQEVFVWVANGMTTTQFERVPSQIFVLVRILIKLYNAEAYTSQQHMVIN